MRRVVGLDGCRGGWVAVTLTDGVVAEVRVVERAADAWACDLDAVAVDIPIGMLDGPREADAAARVVLPGRAASVFSAPARVVVEGYRDGSLSDHATATARSVSATGAGLSMQAWRLVPKIAEVDALAACPDGPPLLEVHPEVAFATVLGHLPPRKTSWPGLALRRRTLAALGLDLPDRFAGDVAAAPDDVVDAAICAWVADGRALGEPLRNLPAIPTQADHGRPIVVTARWPPGETGWVPSRT